MELYLWARLELKVVVTFYFKDAAPSADLIYLEILEQQHSTLESNG